MAQIITTNGAAPSTPASGALAIYSKTDKLLYIKDDTGTESQLSTGTSVTVAPEKLPTIGCTQSGGALTFTAASQYLDFRSTTLTSGTISTVLSAPSNLVLPSGGTLGATSTVSARIVVVEINNAGTAELAIVNIAGGNDLSETGTINTTAISASSTASNVFYSTTARTGVAYRVVGVVDAVNTTGAWGNPVLVQGAGGQAVTAMSSFGYGQTWQSVTRTSGTTYYNTTGRPISLSVLWTHSAGSNGNTIVVGGVTVVNISITSGNVSNSIVTIPIGNSYVITDVNATHTATELR